MEKLREELDEIFLDVEQTKNLALLLEDYFFDTGGDSKFNKNMSLAMTVVEKIANLDRRLDRLYQMTREVATNEN